MSKYTDELFDLCVNIVKTHNVNKLFINAGHSINAGFSGITWKECVT